MDEETISQLLHAWGLDVLIPIFKEHEITLDALPSLIENENMVKELCPKIGLRLILLDKLSQVIHLKESDEETLVSIDEEERTQEESFHVYEESALSTENPPIPTPSSSTSVDLKRKELPTDFSIYDQKEWNQYVVKNFNLKRILSDSVSGNIILYSYQKNKSLTQKNRQSLCEIIINEIFRDGYKSLSCSDFDLLSNKIAEAFGESKETYYIPPCKIRRAGKIVNIVSRGKLVDKYRNVRKELRACGLLGRKVLGELQENIASSKNDNDDISEVVQHSLMWLKHNREPWSDVVAHWQKTTLVRLQSREDSSNSTIAAIFSAYPQLVTAEGHTLVEQDFIHLYGEEKSFRLIKNFNACFEELRKKFGDIIKDEATLRRLQLIDLSIQENDNASTLLKFLCLTYFIPPKGRAKNWKVTNAESSDSFLLCVKSASAVQEAVDNRHKLMLEKKGTVQPFVICVNPTASEVDCAYVIIENHRYRFESVLKAIDICFKSYHVFNVNYTYESEQVWLFLQKAIYGFDTKYDKKMPQVATIVNAMKHVDSFE